ncbi:unnamed protein product, partial [Timema podura]|nr:unnamed protein product [Timema podura]
MGVGKRSAVPATFVAVGQEQEDVPATFVAVGQEDVPATFVVVGQEYIPATCVAVGQEYVIATFVAVGQEDAPVTCFAVGHKFGSHSEFCARNHCVLYPPLLPGLVQWERKVRANDADKDRPLDIVYFLTGQGVDSDNPEHSQFDINRTSGEIFVYKPLDRDLPNGRPQWRFTVFAQDE